MTVIIYVKSERSGSINFHHYHRLSIRTLKALGVILIPQEQIAQPAAQWLFGTEHKNLFDFLVTNVRIPAKLQTHNHDPIKLLAGWERRVV